MEEQRKPANIPLKRLPDTYKMVIPSDVDRKIQYLLCNVFNIEWSGVLFYTYDGSFENGDLVITCKDVLLMDIGNAGSTEFDMSPDVIAYMTENDLLECQMGLVHSHHSLQTFFSSTDTNTLLVEGKDRNNFVSLIVNNAGEYNAAITRRVKFTKVIYEDSVYDYFDSGSKVYKTKYTESGEEVQYFYLNIERDLSKSKLKDLSDRLSEIKNKKFPNKIDNDIIKKGIYNPKNYMSNTPSLFDDYDEKYAENLWKSGKLPEIDDLPKGVHFDKKIVHSVVAQIVTGCVTINEEKLGSLSKVNMNSIYKRRFKSSTNGAFTAFADTLLEYLLWYTDDKVISSKYDEQTQLSILAEDILNELDKLPDNDYIKVFKDKLFDWLL